MGKFFGWLFGILGAAVTFMASFKRADAVSNFGSWFEPLGGFLGPRTDMWIKNIGGAMIAIPIGWWLYMGWRDKYRKKPEEISGALKPVGPHGAHRITMTGNSFRRGKSVISTNVPVEADMRDNTVEDVETVYEIRDTAGAPSAEPPKTKLILRNVEVKNMGGSAIKSERPINLQIEGSNFDNNKSTVDIDDPDKKK